MSQSKPARDGDSAAAAVSPRLSCATARIQARWLLLGIPWYDDDAQSTSKINDPAFCVTIADLQDEITRLEAGVPVPCTLSPLYSALK